MMKLMQSTIPRTLSEGFSYEIKTVVTPVIQKIAIIIRQHIHRFDVECKSFLITPLGIAMHCKI